MAPRTVFLCLALLLVLLLFYLYNTKETFTSRDHSIAIIGAGSAGLYTALKLQAKGFTDITIYEGSDRVGGRDDDVNLKGVILPEGAMRLLPHHTRALAMCKELGIEIIPFHEKDIGIFSRDSDVPNFNLRETERNKTGIELALLVVNAVLEENGIDTKEKLSTERMKELVKTFTHKNKYLYTYNWPDVCADFLSSEAIRFMNVSGGYTCEYTINNAANMFINLNEDRSIFSVPKGSSGMFTPKTGMMSIPEGMYKKFTSLGGNVVFNHRLLSVKKCKGMFELEFEGEGKAFASRVVLTPGVKDLGNIKFSGVNTERLDYMLQSNQSYNAAKLFLEYDTKWWDQSYGRIVTDLPVQQVFLWSENPPTLMVYCDAINAQQLGGYVDTQNYQQLVEILTSQFSQIFGKDVPLPINLYAKHWHSAWSLWKHGYKFWESIDYAKKIDTNLHVASVNFSDEQGWMEGAMNSAQAVVDTISCSK